MPADLLGACQLIMINHPVTIQILSLVFPYLSWKGSVTMMDYNEAYSTKA